MIFFLKLLFSVSKLGISKSRLNSKVRVQMGSPAVAILGMHRSGTSCLAGSLEEAGLVLGQVDRLPHTNPKGNRENKQVMDLNNAVLAANGATWNTPPVAPCEWRTEHIDWRDRLIAEYPTDRLWGFKDPRTLLLLDGWLQGLPNVRLVGSFRHPLAVASSLQTRNGFDIDRSVGIWTQYNRNLLQALNKYEIPLICFDWKADRYDAALQEIAKWLGLTLPTGGFSFFESPLRCDTRDTDTYLPEEARDIYQQLLAHCETPLI